LENKIIRLAIAIGFLFNLSLTQGQNAIVGTGFSTGWGGATCPTGSSGFRYMTSSFGGSFIGDFLPNNVENLYFRFGIGWDMTTAQRTLTLGSDNVVLPSTEYTLNPSCTTSGAMFINASNTTDHYIFKTKNGGTNPAGNFIIFKLSNSPASVINVVTSPNTNQISSNAIVNISATLDKKLPEGQGVYLRYTINDWTSSITVPMTGFDMQMQAAIPIQPNGTVVKYYVFTSGLNLTINHANADFYTINGNTNNGSNYQYTVTSMPQIVVLPDHPADDEAITISLNTQGTALEGANKIYLHSGLSTTQTSLTNFDKVVGNWGNDDDVGLMMPVLGNANKWQIVLPSSRVYFNIADDKDVFGLNFLFRNEDGSQKLDNSGKNYHITTDPGHHFIISNPPNYTGVVQVGQSFTIMAESNTSVSSWVLKDTTSLPATTIYTSIGGTSFSHTITYPDANTRQFKLIAYYPTGQAKDKSFKIIGYNPIIEMPRLIGTKLGINYYENDCTKVTLVLHAPTFTTFKKGTGIISGANSTTPKSIIYIVGDFNNWTPSEAYKLNRDRDGWNGSTDLDNDGDRGDYWWITLTGLTFGQEYVFQYLIDGVLQVADPYTAKVSDKDDGQISENAYPELISFRLQAQDRASILQTGNKKFKWEAPNFTPPAKQKLHIYEMHFRDFTEEGTYLAAITKLDYLKGLGINAIHVLPISEFEGNSSWGYNPNFYFAADKAYGKSDDLKKFIDACHARKILVFNDLVLNHTFQSSVLARMYWNNELGRPTNDNPWLNPEHKMVRNTSGHWGVDINHESMHTQNMVDSILGYWLSEYKFDGFRFDFTKGFGQTNANDFPIGDDWASAYNQDRIDLLIRMVDRMNTYYPSSIAIFEHLANASEDKVLADHGILLWSGVGHHNALKNFILGYNTDDTNIFNSGVYNSSNNNYLNPHLLSYGESHDEERLAYELSQYFNGAKSLNNIIDRLKIAYGFNLLMPGSRMLWQFGELGYDVSINFNGRTGEKPIHWDYYSSSKRRELYNLISRIFKIRKMNSVFDTTPDYGNIGLGSGNISSPRVMRLSSNDNKHVIVVANLDPDASRSVVPSFDVLGDWFRYNGDIEEVVYNVTAANQFSSYTLAPSEMMIFTNFKIDNCTDVRNTNDSGAYSLRNAISCATDGGKIVIEYPIYGDTISLLSSISIDKNLTIEGFESKELTISGSDLSNTVFSIAAGKTVTLDGMKILCSQGNHVGRCIVNNGHLTLKDTDLKETAVSTNGSSIQNQGTLFIERLVSIRK
jgi:glycosidase